MKQKQKSWPDYEVFDHHLFVASTPFCAAYIHGMITAMLCVGMHPWQQVGELMQREIPMLAQEGNINELFNTLLACTQTELDDSDKGLKLMLPHDDETLSERLEALSAWCEGFLEGIAKSNASRLLLDDPVVKEVLTDVEQIKEVAVDVLDTEDNERDYAELIEFIRVSILLIYAQLKQTHIKAKQLH